MKIRYALFLAAAAAFGAYTYYYSDSFSYINGGYWTQNGNIWASGGLTSSDYNGGSLISKLSAPGLTNEYEVNSILTLTQSGGNYATYLRATSNALSGPAAQGTAYVIEIQNPTWNGSTYIATLAGYRIVNGVVTLLSSTQIYCHNGTKVRVVMTYGVYMLAYVDDYFVWASSDSAITTGQPGVGVRGAPSGNSISLTKLGPRYTGSPTPVPQANIAVSAFPNRIDMLWGGSAEPDGPGVFDYHISRNASFMGTVTRAAMDDNTVAPGTTYSYTLQSCDWHWNCGNTTFSVTTPPTSQVDPRRVGVRANGAYWGGMGENVDLLGGNLNVTLPLLKAMGRGGWSVPINLSYNSQQWRRDGSTTWNLGRDIGYGYGWKLLAGSIIPVVTPYVGVHHYLFTDPTGAEYMLSQSNGAGIWTSTEGLSVTFDANTLRLWFNDGSFWLMGTTSASSEEDAGTMYPTQMQDSNGNQVFLTYAPGISVSWPNSSARLATIQDTRTPIGVTYNFTYTADAIPHLQSVTNTVGTAESYSFIYAGNTLTSPFDGSNFGYSGLLCSVSVGSTGLSYQLSTSAAGELVSLIFPYGGSLGWAYQNVTYPGSRVQREVYWRSLSNGVAPQRYFNISRDTSPSPVHAWATVDDTTGNGQKAYWFSTSGGSIGLMTAHEKRLLPGPVARTRDEFSWVQQPTSGNWYIGTVTNKLIEGGATTAQKTTTQTLDAYGNTTQMVQSDWSGGSAPTRTYDNTFKTDSSYLSAYIRNRLVTSKVTASGLQSTLLTNTYDSYAGLSTLTDLPGGAGLHDSSYGTGKIVRGNVTSKVDPAGTSYVAYDTGGNVLKTVSANGTTTTSSPGAGTNYSAPASITTGTLTELLSWTSFLGLQSATGPNGDTSSTIFDSYARPSQTTSSTGAVTTFTYATYAPWTTTATTNGRWTRTTVDGFGRAIKVEKGSGSTSSTPVSIAETTYDACGCNPMGKTTAVSMPRASGAGSVWTSYSYDGLGRTLTVTAPGGSAKTYAYYSNTATVTDEAGKWKKYTMDGFGNVSQVQEPDPVNSGSSYYTYYTYDALNHLITVSMPRPTGLQSRSFSYGSPPGAYLLSATNPETGTVTYSYSGGLLQSKTDAKGQQVTYEYDDKSRLSKVRHWVKNIYGTLIEDTCQLVQLVYDANGDASGFSYLAGRLAERKYSTCQNPNGAGGVSTNFIEMFDYSQAGRVTKKRLRIARGAAQRDLDASWGYDNEGRPASVTYPTDSYNHTAGTYTFGYNALGQLNSMPGVVDSVTYGPAGEVLNISGVYSETRTYNSRLQLTALNGVTFTYFASNNGKIQSQTDPVSGETITYAYDQLNRLISASSNQGWGQGFVYDGFGNLTDKNALAGSVPQLHIGFNPATNRQNGLSYDANGNQTTDTAGANTLQYDVENRLVWAQAGVSSLGNGYGYDPDNRRVYKSVWSPNSGSWALSTETIDFFGVGGEKMSSYTMTVSGSTLTLGVTGSNVYFGGRLVRKVDTWGGWITVKADRLGSFGKFYPYGEERGTTGNDTEKFATYYRDGNTGLDYAVSRYYSAATGRFMSADPYMSGAKPDDPASWNRYSYVQGDPTGFVDPGGLMLAAPNTGCIGLVVDGILWGCLSGTGDGGGGGGGGGGWGLCPGTALLPTTGLGAPMCDDGPVFAPVVWVDPCPGLAQRMWNTINGVGMPGGKSLYRRVAEQIFGQKTLFEGHQVQIEGYRDILKNLRKKWRDNNCDDPMDPPFGVNEWISQTDRGKLKLLNDQWNRYLLLAQAATSAVGAAIAAAEGAEVLGEIVAFLESLGAAGELLPLLGVI